MTTRAQYEQMTDEERERDERLSIMIHEGGLTESEAVAIIEQRQGELLGKYDNDKGNRLRCILRNPR